MNAFAAHTHTTESTHCKCTLLLQHIHTAFATHQTLHTLLLQHIHDTIQHSTHTHWCQPPLMYINISKSPAHTPTGDYLTPYQHAKFPSRIPTQAAASDTYSPPPPLTFQPQQCWTLLLPQGS